MARKENFVSDYSIFNEEVVNCKFMCWETIVRIEITRR